jgi:hypothetical protein
LRIKIRIFSKIESGFTELVNKRLLSRESLWPRRAKTTKAKPKKHKPAMLRPYIPAFFDQPVRGCLQARIEKRYHFPLLRKQYKWHHRRAISTCIAGIISKPPMLNKFCRVITVIFLGRGQQFRAADGLHRKSSRTLAKRRCHRQSWDCLAPTETQAAN